MAASRFGFIVSQKVAKKANQRNLVKRRIREVVRKELGRIRPGYDVVIIAKPAALNKKSQLIKDIILQIFKNARLYD